MMTFDSRKMSGDEREKKKRKRTQLILGEEQWNVWVRQAAGVNGEGLQEDTKLTIIRIQEALCQR